MWDGMGWDGGASEGLVQFPLLSCLGCWGVLLSEITSSNMK